MAAKPNKQLKCTCVLLVFLGLALLGPLSVAKGEQACHAVTQCSCKLDDGRLISLWPIDKKRFPRFTVGDRQGRGYQYQYNPCTPFSNGDTAGNCKNVLGCQSGGVGGGPFAIAYKDPLVVDYNDVIKMYTFSYTGSSAMQGKSRKMVIRLNCDENAADPKLESFEEAPFWTFTSTLTSKYACPGKSSKSSSKLSIGSILCIVLFVSLFVYFAAGIALNKYLLHKEGSEVIPNKKFWADIPSLVKDGAVFSYQKIRNKTGQYEKI